MDPREVTLGGSVGGHRWMQADSGGDNRWTGGDTGKSKGSLGESSGDRHLTDLKLDLRPKRGQGAIGI